MTDLPTIVLAGVPETNRTLYHRIRFAVGDSAVLIAGPGRSLLLVRDIEMDRAHRTARADEVGCAADFAPAGGLSGDRDTALAQAAAECLRRWGIDRINTDRTLPYIFAHHIQQASIGINYDPDLGVRERRAKQPDEIDALRRAQAMTRQAMAMACETVAHTAADRQGVLHHEGAPLTSQRLRRMIAGYLLDRGFSSPHDSIVATLPHCADCHHFGDGPLRTGMSVIIDIFPRDDATRYWGDCTRTVVHGEASEELKRMHAAVVAAKHAATAALRPGVTGEHVHRAAVGVLQQHGYRFDRRPDPRDPAPVMPHGTGHGIGLDVHEPILLDEGAVAILAGEVFTVEPGLYSPLHGSVRVEDMVAVTDQGPQTLGELHEGMDWR